MIINEPDEIRDAKIILYEEITRMAHASWGWTNIHDVIAKLLDLSSYYTKDDYVFAYWLLLEEGKVWGNSPIVRVDDIGRVVWLGDNK